MLIASFSMAELEVLQLADSHLNVFTSLHVALQQLSGRAFSRIPCRVRVDPTRPTLLAFTSGGGTNGGPGHVRFSGIGVPSGEGGAPCFTRSGTALRGCSHNTVPLALRFTSATHNNLTEKSETKLKKRYHSRGQETQSSRKHEQEHTKPPHNHSHNPLPKKNRSTTFFTRIPRKTGT